METNLFTCDMCEKQEASDRNFNPPGWVGITYEIHPSHYVHSERLHICGDCVETHNIKFVNGYVDTSCKKTILKFIVKLLRRKKSAI